MDTPIPCRPADGLDSDQLPFSGMSVDRSSGHKVATHCHPTAQLIYAVAGVIVVTVPDGQWVLPPTRALWIPAGICHEMQTVGEVHLRTLYIRPDLGPAQLDGCQVVHVSPLLRELIVAAVAIAPSTEPARRDQHLIDLLLDELVTAPSLPLRLPWPTDPEIAHVCRKLADHPDDNATLSTWATRLGIDARTVQRRFLRETGMTFGRWRQQARLVHALERLAGGERVLAVALDLGYSSPSAFSSMFKRQFGATPSAYFA